MEQDLNFLLSILTIGVSQKSGLNAFIVTGIFANKNYKNSTLFFSSLSTKIQITSSPPKINSSPPKINPRHLFLYATLINKFYSNHPKPLSDLHSKYDSDLNKPHCQTLINHLLN